MLQENQNEGFIDESFCNNFKPLTENIAVISEPHYEAIKIQGEEERMANSQHELVSSQLHASNAIVATRCQSV